MLSFRFSISILLFFVLIIVSMLIMSLNYDRRLNDYAIEKEKYKQNLEKMTSPIEFGAFGITINNRPKELSIISMGLEKDISRSIAISPWQRTQRGGSRYSNPIFSIFQTPDFVYVISIVVSLLALLFSFDAICGEKENQTLKLMLTNPVPRDIVLVGKWVGGIISIIVPLILAMLTGLLLSVSISSISFAEIEWNRLGMIFFTSILYISFFFALGMLFSSITNNSSTSLIISLFAWVFLVLVIPNISPVLARQFVPLPSVAKMSAERERIAKEERAKMEKSINNLSDADSKKQEVYRRTMEENIKKRTKRLDDYFSNKVEKQISLSINLSRISPSSSFVYATSNLAGTGIEDFKQLKKYIKEYELDFMKNVPKIMDQDRIKEKYKHRVRKPPIDIDAIPPFKMKDVSFEKVLNSSLLDIFLILVYTIIVFLITFVKFLRYDVK